MLFELVVARVTAAKGLLFYIHIACHGGVMALRTILCYLLAVACDQLQKSREIFSKQFVNIFIQIQPPVLKEGGRL
jgi:hypothetical protein